MNEFIPPQPPNSFRVTIEVLAKNGRLDNLLLLALREQKANLEFQNISRTRFKELFSQGKIQIKGQRARPSSSLNRGLTYIDIL